MVVMVLNASHSGFHDFVGHTKEVSGLACYHNRPLIMSVSLDSTLRVWSVKTYQEVYRLELQTQPIGLCLMDNIELFYWSKDEITFGSLCHLNHYFASFRFATW